MASCNHAVLELIPAPKPRLRCRQCQLTLAREDLGDGFCPECFDRSGKRQCEFDEVPAEQGGASKYRCEACGVIVTT